MIQSILIWAGIASLLTVAYCIYRRGKSSARLEIMEKSYHERDKIEKAAAEKSAQIDGSHDDRVNAVRDRVSTEIESLANTAADLLDQRPNHDNN